ncbi:MAG TPA: AraC family transcriptional regulator, partial [Usitatibacter sp.]|nr:AraC family transcriptional regulator [Usitatibacter sp.]
MEVLPSQLPVASWPAASAAIPPARAAPRIAACDTMSVEFRELRTGEEIIVESGEIAVAVPFAGAACHARFADGAGRAREADLADPDIAILPSPGRHALVVEHEGALLLARLDAARWAGRTREALGHAREIRECHLGDDGFVRGLAGLISESLAPGGAPAAEWLQAVGDDLALHLATRYARPTEVAAFPGLAPHRLQRVLSLIEERLAEAIQVRDLAAAVHMSPYHFARMFKQSTGQPPHLFITWQRMDRAKALLAQSALPLAEVATRVGY